MGNTERDSALYPIFLRLNGTQVLVVGGGKVAERKIEGLLESDPKICVVAPDAVPAIQKWAEVGQVDWLAREFEPDDLEQARLVIAATDREEVNRTIVEEAKQRGIWANSATDSRSGDAHIPARMMRGPLQVAVSTSGMSPAAAVQIRDRIAACLEDEFGLYLDLLQEIRIKVKSAVQAADQRAEIIRWFVQSELFELIAREDPQHVREWVESRLRKFKIIQ